MNIIEKLLSYVGAISTGGILMAVINIYLTPTVSKARIFQEENKQTVIRLYRSIGATDGILVEDPKEKNNYIGLETYLENNFTDKYDKNIENERIKKLISW